MWPFERQKVREYLRIGSQAVERWAGPATALVRVDHRILDNRTLPSARSVDDSQLGPAIRALYPTKPQAAVTVLLESAWLPVLLLEVGPALWNSAQVEPLLRHRLHMLYGGQQLTAADWELRLDYRAGERFALGYGLPLPLKQILVAAGEAVGQPWAALLPAWAWGLQHLRPARHWVGRSGWWLWPEQDRLLLARISANRIVAFHPGQALTEDPAQIARMVAVEGLRAGMPASGSHEPIGAATWLSPRTDQATDRLHWVPIAGSASVLGGPSVVPSIAGVQAGMSV